MSNELLRPLPQQAKEGSAQVKWILDRFEQKLIKPAKIELPEAFKLIFIEAMKDPDVMPFMYSNHYDLANGLPMAVMSKIFTDLANRVRDPSNPFKGFLMPVSRTLLNGNQGLFMQGITDQANTGFFIPKYNLFMVGCTTENDKIKRDTNDSNLKFMLDVSRIARNRNGGIAPFLEASVEGGRLIKEGEYRGQRKGLQEFDSHRANEIIDLLTIRFGRKILYIPLGLFGPNLLHADNRIPTMTALRALASKNPKTLINVKVGKPTTHEEMINQITELNKGKDVLKEDISKRLREMVAHLLPSDFLPPKNYK
ncbi:MAG: hypothetical protein Q8P29_04655 [Candidatus Levybacteria bacterium]|nr:hypothetical protein [Candidatus Levybacteria bacterium]